MSNHRQILIKIGSNCPWLESDHASDSITSIWIQLSRLTSPFNKSEDFLNCLSLAVTVQEMQLKRIPFSETKPVQTKIETNCLNFLIFVLTTLFDLPCEQLVSSTPNERETTDVYKTWTPAMDHPMDLVHGPPLIFKGK